MPIMSTHHLNYQKTQNTTLRTCWWLAFSRPSSWFCRLVGGLFGEMTKKTFFPTYQDRVKTVFEGPIWAYNIIQTVSNSMMITCKN